MGQRVRRRAIDTVTYSSGNKTVIDLPKGLILRDLELTLKGAATTTAGNNTAANTQSGDEWGVVKKIEVIANGTDVIKSISGNALWWLNLFLYGTAPNVTTTLGDGATANPAFSSSLILPFWMPNSIRPIDTALDTRNLSALKLEVTWGTYTDINSASTAWTTNPTLEVGSNESFNIDGDFSQWRFWTIEKEITATNSKFQISLPVGHLFRGFLINTTDAGVDQGDIINNFRWQSGPTVFADLSEERLKRYQHLRGGISRGFSGTAYDDYRIGNNNSYDGWYFYDHVQDGFNSESEDTLGLSEHELELDVTVGGGTTKVFVYPQVIIPVRQ